MYWVHTYDIHSRRDVVNVSSSLRVPGTQSHCTEKSILLQHRTAWSIRMCFASPYGVINVGDMWLIVSQKRVPTAIGTQPPFPSPTINNPPVRWPRMCSWKVPGGHTKNINSATSNQIPSSPPPSFHSQGMKPYAQPRRPALPSPLASLPFALKKSIPCLAQLLKRRQPKKKTKNKKKKPPQLM